MSEAPFVPLEGEHLPVASTFPGKNKGVLLAASGGSLLLLLLAMAAHPGLPGGWLIGWLATAVASVATVRLCGVPSSEPPARSLAARELWGPLAHTFAALLVLWGALRLGVLGVIPHQVLSLALVVPAAFLWLVFGLLATLGRLGWLAEPDRPWWRRHGVWLIVLTTLLYLPRLGSYGLIDPWEPHYGEVAREMLSRDDWISLWWAQDGWFWSKPILNFWAQGLSFSAFGVDWVPDHVIASVAIGRTPQPEWAARFPIFLMALAGQQVLYSGARAYVGRLAAFLGMLVLATTPYWYLLAHQSMADMPYVAPLTAAMGFLLLALRAAPDARVRTVEVRLSRSSSGPRLLLSAYDLAFAVVLLLVIPQVVYLISRNVTLQWGDLPLRLRLHVDHVLSGSTGNCELPGNTPCRPDPEASHEALSPAGAGLLWAGVCSVLLWLKRGERREKRLYYLAAWVAVALSFMGKGAPGLVLVLFTFAGVLIVRRRFGEFRHAEWLSLVLIFACVGLPWFVQEYLRHGFEFFERLFIHDMYLRAFDHVHDTNKGDDTSFRYYVWQLGYGLFPWSGIAAVATLRAIRSTLAAPAVRPAVSGSPVASDSPAALGAEFVYFCVLWQLAAFGMFAITGTKFHHYILPLVPAVALLAGVYLAACFDRSPSAALEGNAARIRAFALSDAVWALGATVLVLLAGRDLAVTRNGDVEGAARLLQLFTYNYARSWPATLDYSKPLWVFTAAAAVCCFAAIGGVRLRRWAALGACTVGGLACAWGINVYLVQISPHWGQRETISEYYKRRAGPEEPLVAYQLNWKGENFYTGNDVPVFVSSGKPFTDWVQSQKKNGVAVMFFTTEHSRVSTLERELGSPQKFELITDKTLNDKFVLARAVL